MKKRIVMAIIALILFAYACVGLEKLFGETPASEEPESKEPALRMYSGEEPPVLDPALIDVGEPGGICGPLLFPSLTGVDSEGNPIPGLAESWESSMDGTRWTIHLRRDISWVRYDPETGDAVAVHSVTSDDVIYSLQRQIRSLVQQPETLDPAWSFFVWIKGGQKVLSGSGSPDQLGVRAVNDQTLEIELNFPVENFPLGRLMYAVPEELVEQFGENWTEPENIWIYGPYLIDQWNQDDNKLILGKNPLHPNAADNLVERIEVVYGIQPTQALEMYKNGELDILPVQSENLEGILQDPQLSQQLYYGPRVRVVGLLFNTAKPPFNNNQHVLQAFLYAVNQDEIVQSILDLGRRGDISINQIICKMWINGTHVHGWYGTDYNPVVAKQELEISGIEEEIAQELLKEDDFAREFASMQVPKNPEIQEVGSILQANWKEYLGIDVELVNQEWAVFPDFESEDGPNMYLGSYYQWGWAKTPDGLSYLSDINQIEVFPLYMTYTDPYLLSPAVYSYDADENILTWYDYYFTGFKPATEISCPPVPQPSANELTEQCMETVMQAKQAFEKHDCDTWVPLSEDALLLATEALSIEGKNAKALCCSGLANYYLARLPQALSDLEKAQELGDSGCEEDLNALVPGIREMVEAPACTISPMQFFEGWGENGEPINPSDEHSGNDLSTIEVFWELKEPCDTVCQVIWKNNHRKVCWHDYYPHELYGYEGSMFSSDDNGPMNGHWRIEYWCAGELAGAIETVIP
jgi:oligopeptide transport system substrate-binding protein